MCQLWVYHGENSNGLVILYGMYMGLYERMKGSLPDNFTWLETYLANGSMYSCSPKFLTKRSCQEENLHCFMNLCLTYMYHPLVLKARHLSGSTSCNFHRLEVPEQALGGIPLGLDWLLKINLLN